MSKIEPPPASEPRAVGHGAATVPPPAAEAPPVPPSGQGHELVVARRGGTDPEVDLATMRAVHARVGLLVRTAPVERAHGYRLFAVRGCRISWVDIGLAGTGYAVLGSRHGCDLVLSGDADVSPRHLAALVVRNGDRGLGVRILDLKTGVPFFVEDDTPRWSAFAHGPFSMRLSRHVVCGFPVALLDGRQGDAAQDGALGAPPVVEPAPPSGPIASLGASSAGGIRVTLTCGHVGAAGELPPKVLDEGVILGRSLDGFDAGLRRVLSDGAISRAHVLLLRSGAELFAYDLCSTNGTRVAGKRVRRHRIKSAESTVELGKTVTLHITGSKG